MKTKRAVSPGLAALPLADQRLGNVYAQMLYPKLVDEGMAQPMKRQVLAIETAGNLIATIAG